MLYHLHEFQRSLLSPVLAYAEANLVPVDPAQTKAQIIAAIEAADEEQEEVEA